MEHILNEIRFVIFDAMSKDLDTIRECQSTNNEKNEIQKIIKSHARFFIIYGKILELIQNNDMFFHIPITDRRLVICYDVKTIIHEGIKTLKDKIPDKSNLTAITILEQRLIDLDLINI